MRCLTSWELVDVTGLLLPSCPLTMQVLGGCHVVQQGRFFGGQEAGCCTFAADILVPF